MAIKIDIISPVQSTVSDTPGNSRVIEVVRTLDRPLTTDSTRAVIDVVGKNVVDGIVKQQETPSEPYNGMLWFSW